MAGQGRNIIVEQDGSGRIQVTADGAPWALAVPMTGTHEDMLASGYAKLLDRFPTARVHPLAPAVLDLRELYVLTEFKSHNVG